MSKNILNALFLVGRIVGYFVIFPLCAIAIILALGSILFSTKGISFLWEKENYMNLLMLFPFIFCLVLLLEKIYFHVNLSKKKIIIEILLSVLLTIGFYILSFQ